MKKIQLLKQLEKYAVFDLSTLKEIIKKEKNYSKLVLFRLKQQGLIFEIERNKYTLHKNPLVIASSLIWPCYLSLWTALRYYNLTEQLPKNIFVITTRARKRQKIVFAGLRIIFVKVKPRFFFGFTKERFDSFNIFIAEPEKALIDSVLLRKISFSEIAAIVQANPDKISAARILKYLLQIKNKALAKRFGFLLDKLGHDYFSKLKSYVSSNYCALDYAMPLKGKRNKKWKVIENVKL